MDQNKQGLVNLKKGGVNMDKIRVVTEEKAVNILGGKIVTDIYLVDKEEKEFYGRAYDGGDLFVKKAEALEIVRKLNAERAAEEENTGLTITQLITEGETGKVYEIVKTSAPSWIGVKVKVCEPVTFNIEPFRSVIVVDATKGTPAAGYIKKSLPLLGAVVGAMFKVVE